MAAFKAVTDKSVASAKPGVYTIEPNLILRVSNSGSRSWVFRWQSGGKIRQLGLGGYPTRSLKSARELAEELREDVANGRDPVERVKPSPAKTFKHYALAYIGEFESGWRNPKHRQQWRNTLVDYVYPHIGERTVSEISSAHIHNLLLPMWAIKTETATRVRMRIEAVLDYGFTKEGIDRRNPARWKGNLDKLLPNPRKTAKAAGKRKSHPAPPHADVPAIMAKLRAKPSIVSALALRFQILCAARSTEVRAMTWDEVDLEGRVWRLPGSRAKNGEAHNVPLNDEAAEILAYMTEHKFPDCERVFPGAKGGLLSDVSINKQLHAAYVGITAHGIARSSFRDWVAEKTGFSDKVAEAALNHVNPNATEAAYLRTKFLDERVKLMTAWGEYVASNGNVVRSVG